MIVVIGPIPHRPLLDQQLLPNPCDPAAFPGMSDWDLLLKANTSIDDPSHKSE
jgi:hypothetical protein